MTTSLVSPRAKHNGTTSTGKTWAAVVVLIFCLYGAHLSRHHARATATQSSGNDVVFVTEDTAAFEDGCDAISVFDVNDGHAILRGETIVSPGRLAISGKGDIVFASRANGLITWDELLDPVRTRSPKDIYAFVQAVGNDDWVTVALDSDLPVQQAGGVALSRDDKFLYVATRQNDSECLGNGTHGIAKYRIDEIDWNSRRLGRPIATIQTDYAVANILIGLDDSQIYTVATDEIGRAGVRRIFVDALDASTLEPTRNTIDVRTNSSMMSRCAVGTVHASLSPSGSYLLINSWRSPTLVLVDLRTGQVHRQDITGLTMTGDVSFNNQVINAGMVAIHGIDEVVIMRLGAFGDMSEVARASVARPDTTDDEASGAKASLAWSADGASVIVAEGRTGEGEFSIWDMTADRQLIRRSWLEACSHRTRNYQNDIITLNERGPVITVPPEPTPTPHVTDTPPPTPTATCTPTSTATPRPQPVYLPVSLREKPCTREKRADVVLVMDASSSMNEPAGDGRTKIEVAEAAAAAFLGRLKLDAGDQAAVVAFNSYARLVIGLTSNRPALTLALSSITTASQTCLVCGLEAAGAELASARRRAENQAVVILLTDGRSNPRPASEAVTEAARLKERGASVFTIGLGTDLDEAALTVIASKPAFAHRVADGTALEEIYRQIAATLPGPADCYWGKR